MFKKIVCGLPIVSMGLGLMTGTDVHAAATASAALSNVHIELIDLDPLDGIAPSLSFDGTWVSSYNQITLNGSPQQNFLTGTPLGGALGPFVSGSGTTSAQLQVFAGSLLTGTGPAATAFATASGYGNAAASVSEMISMGFTLTPHTRIVMTGNATQAQVSGALGESGSAGNILGLLRLFPDSSTTGSTDTTAAFLNADGLTYGSAPPRGLEVSFENTSGSPMAGYAMAYSYAMAYGVTTVPEPQSMALLLGGMAVLGIAVRRRRAG